MNPVLHQVGQQCKEARCNGPEHFDYSSGKRTVFRGEQFTSHYETWQNYSLKRMQNSNFICTGKLHLYIIVMPAMSYTIGLL